MKTPILGSSYVARSVNAADNRMVNLFPEMVPEGGKEPAFLSKVPGLNILNDPVGAGPMRGVYTMNYSTSSTPAAYLLYVSGDELYIKDDWNDLPSLVGSGIVGSGLVQFADNGAQVYITSGILDGPAYIFDMATLTLTAITDPDFTTARTVTYLDGFFIFNETTGQKVWCSALLDGSSVDALSYASAEANPDGLLCVKAIQDELWLFGVNTTEVWYNAGTPGFPFAPIQGSFNEVGCMAPNTVAKLDNTLMWLGRDERGSCIVYRSNGYRAERVSTHAVEWQIQQYNINYTDIFEAVAYTYQQDGHTFYVLSLPSDDKTWVYDVTTGAWHERCGYSGGVLTRHPGICHASYYGRPVIGTYLDTRLYYYDPAHYVNGTQQMKWLRSWRALATGVNNLKRTAQHSLQLDCESGVTNDSQPLTPQQITLRWSDDGGHTWSNDHTITMGAPGDYGARVIWRRLGMTQKLRDRVYEVSGIAPVKIYIMGAELLLSPTNA